MYRFIILCLFILISMPAFATRTVVTQNPYFRSNNYYPQSNIYNNNFNDLNQLEKYAFNRTFNTDSKLQRLERLEELAFGSVQQGDIYSRYQIVKNVIFAQPNNTNRHSFFRNLQKFFSGQLTGYTPPISDYYSETQHYPNYRESFYNGSYFPSNVGNSSFVNFIGPHGRGYRYNNATNGSSGGIRILD